MKRFHVHVAVPDLAHGISFYSTMFSAKPAVVKDDYAKWMLDDPRINFAISTRGYATGVNHLGFQVDDDDELVAMHDQLQGADEELVTQTGTTCCYAKADKYWVTDPAGIAWETFHTLSDVPVFGADTQPQVAAPSTACCAPAAVELPRTGACCPSAE
ncbi:MAG: ArsI/CadI family heavy metal resistance metalloenzyme [Gammaproteobacteria bacterium]